jgi:hypothetical protein
VEVLGEQLGQRLLVQRRQEQVRRLLVREQVQVQQLLEQQ